MVFPEGTMWDGELMFVVIGIAAVGDEHLSILANIADKLSDMEAVKKLIVSDVDTIYNIFMGKE